MELKEIKLEKIKEIFKNKGYVIFDNRPYNINLFAIRAKTSKPNSYDDLIGVFYHNEFGLEAFHLFPATTDPGLFYLENPMNVKGTAILAEGQYRGVFRLGKYKGLDAFIQQRQVTVIRDFDRDKELDFDSAKTETGMIGLHLHQESILINSTEVNKASAGCQVPQNNSDHNELVSIARKSAKIFGNSFTYTLINEKDFENKKAKPKEVQSKTKKTADAGSAEQ